MVWTVYYTNSSREFAHRRDAIEAAMDRDDLVSIGVVWNLSQKQFPDYGREYTAHRALAEARGESFVY